MHRMAGEGWFENRFSILVVLCGHHQVNIYKINFWWLWPERAQACLLYIHVAFVTFLTIAETACE